MKINVPLVLVLALAVGISFASCASTPAETTSKSVTKSKDIVKEEPKIEKFVDWQFKGFGKEIPESAEKVFTSIDFNSMESDAVIVENNTFTVLGKGSNPDQAINVLEDSFEKHLAAYEENHQLNELSLVEDYWLKVNQEVWNTDKPYVAIRIYEIN